MSSPNVKAEGTSINSGKLKQIDYFKFTFLLIVCTTGWREGNTE